MTFIKARNSRYLQIWVVYAVPSIRHHYGRASFNPLLRHVASSHAAK